MTSVNQYRVWCTGGTPHYETTWGTSEPTICPSDAGPINTSLTTIIQTVSSNDVEVTNLQKGAFGELSISELTPIAQLSFSYNLSSQLMTTTTTGSGTAVQANHMGVVSTGAAITSSANISSTKPIKYRPGQGISIRFTGLFTPGVIGSTQKIGGFNGYDGIGFGYDGPSFGIFHKKNGIITWIYQTVWNLDKFDGTGSSGVNINFASGYGNVFEVKYQYLGFGALIFCVENPETGKYIPVHIIRYANTSITPSFHVASFPLALEVNNTTNNTDIILKSGSLMGGVEGKLIYTGPQFNSQWLSSTVNNGIETFIAAWNVLTTFNGHSNKTILYLTQYSLASGSTDKPQILRFRRGSTFTSPVWTDIQTGQSVVQKLTGGTWNSGTGVVSSLIMVPGKGDPFFRDLIIGDFYGVPGDNLVITLEGVGGSGVSSGSLSWLEDQ